MDILREFFNYNQTALHPDRNSGLKRRNEPFYAIADDKRTSFGKIRGKIYLLEDFLHYFQIVFTSLFNLIYLPDTDPNTDPDPDTQTWNSGFNVGVF